MGKLLGYMVLYWRAEKIVITKSYWKNMAAIEETFTASLNCIITNCNKMQPIHNWY